MLVIVVVLTDATPSATSPPPCSTSISLSHFEPRSLFTETHMKSFLLMLALLSLALTGCVYYPNGGYQDRGYGDRGWNNGGHAEYHAERGYWDHQ
jgi:hypothetical protein